MAAGQKASGPTVARAGSRFLRAGARAARAGSAPTVSVRIEGPRRTLLQARMVRPGSGYITRYGAPRGVCPEDSVQGALNAATRGRWGGSYSAQYQEYFITSILGVQESGKQVYWEILTDNVPAQAGACQLRLHRGEQILFAPVPASGPYVEPIGLRAPARATVGRAFSVRVVAYDARGRAHPLAGVSVIAGSERATSNAQGLVRLTATRAGRLTIRAQRRGYIRDEATVLVRR